MVGHLLALWTWILISLKREPWLMPLPQKRRRPADQESRTAIVGSTRSHCQRPRNSNLATIWWWKSAPQEPRQLLHRQRTHPANKFFGRRKLLLPGLMAGSC